jgi:hypothetical protein
MSKVNKGYALDVREMVMFLRSNYAERKAPTDSALARARALVNSAAYQVDPPSEATEAEVDELHGLFMWGRMLAPILNIDPCVLALQRRMRRGRAAARDRDAAAAAAVIEVTDKRPEGGLVSTPDQQPSTSPSHRMQPRGPRRAR